MAWNFWANEQMTTLFGAANGANRLQNTVFQAVGEVRDYVFYFGNPTAGTQIQAAMNSGTDPIKLFAQSALKAWAASTSYAENTVIGAGGYLFKCITAGDSGTSEPSWLKKAGSNTADGKAVWRCIGQDHSIDEVKIALSQDALANATSSVNLGVTIPSGTAIKVYLRLTNTVPELYDLPAVIQMRITHNDFIETAV